VDTYSLDFLETDWVGAGFDFGLGCVFEGDQENKASSPEFVGQVSRIVREFTVHYVLEERPTESRAVTGEALSDFLKSGLTFEDVQLLQISVTTRNLFRGSCDLTRPFQLELYGPSNAFYSGNAGRDILIARDIMEIAMIAVAIFGDGWG
jgi:hypothetical protein